MKKELAKKLELNKDTIARLNEEDLEVIKGGNIPVLIIPPPYPLDTWDCYKSYGC